MGNGSSQIQNGPLASTIHLIGTAKQVFSFSVGISLAKRLKDLSSSVERELNKITFRWTKEKDYEMHHNSGVVAVEPMCLTRCCYPSLSHLFFFSPLQRR